MKRLSLYLFIILLSLQTPSQADDIRDFQIEGMSIGDSALDYFNESHIKKNTWDYPNNKFKRVQNDNMPFFNTYDAIDFLYKTKDSKYIIHSITGVLFFKKNIEDCYKKMDEVANEIEKALSNIKFNEKETWKHPSPKNKFGKSKVTDTFSVFQNGDQVTISCYDYSKEHAVNQNHLAINIDNNEFKKWLRDKSIQIITHGPHNPVPCGLVSKYS